MVMIKSYAGLVSLGKRIVCFGSDNVMCSEGFELAVVATAAFMADGRIADGRIAVGRIAVGRVAVGRVAVGVCSGTAFKSFLTSTAWDVLEGFGLVLFGLVGLFALPSTTLGMFGQPVLP